MQIIVKGKNGAVIPNGFREYAEKKLQKLERYFHAIQRVEVQQSTERGQHRVEINLDCDGVFLRGEERKGDLYAALDQVIEKIERQLKRYKTKLRDIHRQPAPEKEATTVAGAASGMELLAGEEEAFTPRIVRRKRFPMKPMSSEEAARQMELLDHDFFLFLNEETGEYNVLYRRREGEYGLIEPES
jgi:putative sigma-54 modulation protein